MYCIHQIDQCTQSRIYLSNHMWDEHRIKTWMENFKQYNVTKSKNLEFSSLADIIR